MSKRIVYVHPGEMIEFRFVHPDSDKSAAGWREQLRPQHLLLMMRSGTCISAADPAVSLHDWPRATPPATGASHDE